MDVVGVIAPFPLRILRLICRSLLYLYRNLSKKASKILNNIIIMISIKLSQIVIIFFIIMKYDLHKATDLTP